MGAGQRINVVSYFFCFLQGASSPWANQISGVGTRKQIITPYWPPYLPDED